MRFPKTSKRIVSLLFRSDIRGKTVDLFGEIHKCRIKFNVKELWGQFNFYPWSFCVWKASLVPSDLSFCIITSVIRGYLGIFPPFPLFPFSVSFFLQEYLLLLGKTFKREYIRLPGQNFDPSGECP